MRTKKADLCVRCGNPTAPNSAYCEHHLQKARINRERVDMNNQKICIQHYGCECDCCGLGLLELLQIDHVNGGGTKHFKQKGSSKVYKQIIEEGFPDHYRVRCVFCNFARSQTLDGKCPHEHWSAEHREILKNTNRLFTSFKNNQDNLHLREVVINQLTSLLPTLN